MNVARPFISACSITLLTKPRKGVLKRFRYSYSVYTHVWKYRSLKSILLRYLDRASPFRIVAWLGNCLSSVLVLSLRGVRSTRGLILPSVFSWSNRVAAPGTSFRYMTPSYSFWANYSFSLSSYFSETLNVGCLLRFSLFFNRIQWLDLRNGCNLSRIGSRKTSGNIAMTSSIVAIAAALTSLLVGVQFTLTWCLGKSILEFPHSMVSWFLHRNSIPIKASYFARFPTIILLFLVHIFSIVISTAHCFLLVDCEPFMALWIWSSPYNTLVSTPWVVTNAALRMSSHMVPLSNSALASWLLIVIVSALALLALVSLGAVLPDTA